MQFEPWGTVFVVFRKPTTKLAYTLPAKEEKQIAVIDGPWHVSFETGRGAPPSVTLNTLASWSENTDTGVKYFSGAGTYTRTVMASREWFKPGARIWLDLGEVKNLADVTVNGRSLGTLWHAPYRVDVTDQLRPGANMIAIKVTNAWVNRYDRRPQQPGAQARFTFTVIHPYAADEPLLPSGLLGPVRISLVQPAQ